ncbi:MAG: hypothetical protein GXO37_03620 [Chloroflexi bacterium]|nr:hypothetical protein [Chloroflexota bacterium]
MWRYDFHLFYQAGQAVLQGASPYAIPDFYPPYLLAMLFAPLTLLPEGLAYGLYVTLQIALLFKVRRWRAVWPLLSFPVAFALFVGQVDFLLALLSVLWGPWALPLLLSKPQIAFIVAPSWWPQLRQQPRRAGYVLGLSLAFVALSFVLRPTWVAEWLAATPSATAYAVRDASLYWLVPAAYKPVAWLVGVPLALGLTLKGRLQAPSLAWPVRYLFAPFTNIYSASALFQWIGPWEVVLSWLAIFWVGTPHRGAPMFVVALSILGRQMYAQRRKRKFV